MFLSHYVQLLQILCIKLLVLPGPKVRIQREARKWTLGIIKNQFFLMQESTVSSARGKI